MDKKNIIIAILTTALVTMCGYFVFQNWILELEIAKIKNENAIETTGKTTPKTPQMVTSNRASQIKTGKSIKDIISLKKPTACVNDNKNYRIEIFADNNQAAVTTTTINEEKTTVTNMIIKDGYQYHWTEGNSKDAYKTNIALIAKEAPMVNQATNNFGMDNEIVYDCHNWTADGKVFIVPDNIVFTDNTERVKNMRIDSAEN